MASSKALEFGQSSFSPEIFSIFSNPWCGDLAFFAMSTRLILLLVSVNSTPNITFKTEPKKVHGICRKAKRILQRRCQLPLDLAKFEFQ